MSSRSRSTVASACCATPSSPRADSGDKHVGHPTAPPGRPVGARRCRGADTCAGRRRGPGQGRHNRRQQTGSVGAQGYLCLDAPLPAIPGIELNGTVIDRGRDVTEPAPSQAVFVSGRDLRVRAGCYTEYIAVPAHAVHSLPPGCELEAAACLSNYQVAYHALHSATRGVAAECVLVRTGASVVGSAAVEHALIAGMQVIGVSGSEAKRRAVGALGAQRQSSARETDGSNASCFNG
jgi:hypothetical protein